ncbi:MAG: NAD(P)-dependent oxidoreductase [Chloroflexi bacterium]|nr:NAD(P)-dependent oxidoreductase [Chloroflexota bacterium]
MNIVLFGANGRIGQRILQEAMRREHRVRAVVRRPQNTQISHSQITIVSGDVLDSESVASAADGQDVIISAVGPGREDDPEMLVQAAQALLQGAAQAGVRRLIVVGGAGSLQAAPGVQLMDTPEFPESWKPVARAHRRALDVYRKSELDWTVLSPAGMIEPGQRTGKYRTALEQLLRDANGESLISMEDFAVALMDEVEQPKYIRQRFTAAY